MSSLRLQRSDLDDAICQNSHPFPHEIVSDSLMFLLLPSLLRMCEFYVPILRVLYQIIKKQIAKIVGRVGILSVMQLMRGLSRMVWDGRKNSENI